MPPKILAITLADPFRARHGGSMRTTAFVSAMKASGADVDLAYPASTVGTRALAARSNTRSVSIKSRASAWIARAKHRLLPMPTLAGARNRDLAARTAAGDQDVVLISALSQVRFSDDAPGWLWLDFMDVWSDFARVEARHRRGVSRASASMQARVLSRLEERYGKGARLVTAAGWTDHELLRARGIPAVWVPTPLADEEFGVVDRQGSSTPTAGFLGNFEYWPNRDALDALITHWYPELKAKGWNLLIAGHGSDDLRDLVPPDVELLGRVGDVNDFYSRIDLTLAPIRLGGGMKVKVLESLSRGRPVIGTRAALEGFPPGVRALCVEAALDGFDAPAAAQLSNPDPSGTDLEPFKLSAVTAALSRLLREGTDAHD